MLIMPAILKAEYSSSSSWSDILSSSTTLRVVGRYYGASLPSFRDYVSRVQPDPFAAMSETWLWRRNPWMSR